MSPVSLQRLATCALAGLLLASPSASLVAAQAPTTAPASATDPGRATSPAPATGPTQTAAPIPPPVAGGQPATESGPIAAPDLAVAAKKTLNRLRHLRLLIQPAREVTRIEAEMPAVTRYLATLEDDLSATAPERLAPRRLEDATLRWRRHEATLDGWMQIL